MEITPGFLGLVAFMLSLLFAFLLVDILREEEEDSK